MQAGTPKRRTLLVAVLAAILLSLIEAAQYRVVALLTGEAEPPWLQSWMAHLPTWLALVVLIPGILWIGRWYPLDPASPRRNWIVHGIACVGFPLVHVSVAMVGWYWVYMRFEPDLAILPRFARITATHYVMELFLYWVIVISQSAVRFQQRYRDRELEAALLRAQTGQLQASVSQAQLNALRWQLNPHFLFNTLNAITVLSEQRQYSAVSDMTRRLSKLLRISLERTETVTEFSDELEFIRHYLEIEEARFGERLRILWRTDENSLAVKVPALILQPLVENAMKHGVANSPDPVVVEIGSKVTEDRLRIWVRDTGPGRARHDSPVADGVGLANTRARLQELYRGRAVLTIDTEGMINSNGGAVHRTGFTIELNLPTEI